MPICNECGMAVSDLVKVQDPSWNKNFVLGGVLIKPIEVCEDCQSQINQDYQERLDEEAMEHGT